MDPPCGFASYTSYTNQQEAVMRAPLLGGLTIVALLALGSCKDDVGITVTERFAATLSGANVVPTPITTTATGSAQFTYVGDIKTLFFEVDVAGELGAPTGMTLDSLLVLMRNGHAYVNVHTVAHPAGEIRGQVVKQ